MHILRIDSSAREADSTSRQLGDTLINRLQATHAADLTVFNTNDAVPYVTADWINANFTPADDRSDAQRATLAYSDQRVAELQAADLVVITVPMYNFSVPASLKAWIDMVARAGLTFRYTENGPVGLLENTAAIILTTTGGVPVDSPVDFATPYLKHVLGFIGIHDVSVVSATGLAGSSDPDALIAEAHARATALAEAM